MSPIPILQRSKIVRITVGSFLTATNYRIESQQVGEPVRLTHGAARAFIFGGSASAPGRTQRNGFKRRRPFFEYRVKNAVQINLKVFLSRVTPSPHAASSVAPSVEQMLPVNR